MTAHGPPVAHPPAIAARHVIREHALDGARLFFQPATGVHVRVENDRTRTVRRTAPRVAMFGITNACNLRCDFCSRDVARESAWTVASAAAVLRGLCEAGTLEVAYGGGEPFEFRGFAELVEELDATTVLAQHVTTNGTLIEPGMWRRFAAWRTQQPLLAAPSPRRGCARLLPLALTPAAPPVAVWQSFSGNNSGECFLVARFEEAADAEAYLAELFPGWNVDGTMSAAWRKLFLDERVAGPLLTGPVHVEPGEEAEHEYRWTQSPRELLAIGRSVVAVQYDSGDAFAELRALAWKRGAYVVPGGIHVHDGYTLLAAVRCADDGADRDRVLAAGAGAGLRAYPHGDVVLVTAPILAEGTPLATLAAVRDAVLALAGPRRFAVELFFDEVSDAALIAAKKQLAHRPAQRERLWLHFWAYDRDAESCATAKEMVELCGKDRSTRCDSSVLVDPAPDRKRLAVLAYRRGGYVRALDGEEVAVGTPVWFDRPPPRKGRRADPAPTIDATALEAALRASLPSTDELRVVVPDRPWRPGADVTIVTANPARALTVLAAQIAALGARCSPWVSDREPLAAALRRLLDDV